MSSDKPLWHDLSRHQGTVDFGLLQLNGCWGVMLRSGISWGYIDGFWRTNWTQCRQQSDMARTSYHVLYTDQPLLHYGSKRGQIDAWYELHETIEGIPRCMDLEVERPDHPERKAEALWNASEIILRRDGLRPIIYSRANILNRWLASWTDEMLNSHYYSLAQYYQFPFRHIEHPGPPVLPSRVNRDRVLWHQTTDKKAGPDGAVQSAALDYQRWQLGDTQQMHAFIQNEWGGEIPEPEPTGNWSTDIDAWARTQGFDSQYPPPVI